MRQFVHVLPQELPGLQWRARDLVICLFFHSFIHLWLSFVRDDHGQPLRGPWSNVFFFFFFFFSGKLIPGWNFRLGCSILVNPCGNVPVRWGSQWSTVTAPSQARPLLGTVGVQRSSVDGCFQNRGHPCWTGSQRSQRAPAIPTVRNQLVAYACVREDVGDKEMNPFHLSSVSIPRD